MTEWLAPLPAELRLAIACCRAGYGAAGPEIGRLAAAVDWPALVAAARRHRVRPLVHHGLVQAGVAPPPPFAAKLADAAAARAADGLRSAAEAARLHRALSAADIDHLFVKGLALAALAYGSPALKESVDIDLLIAPERLAAAATVLAALGYRPSLPADPQRLGQWHRRRKESVWTNGTQQLDLHIRLADDPRTLASVGLAAPRRRVAVIAGVDLPTLAETPTVAHLVVHGASSGWFRLKWLSDLAAMLARADDLAALHGACRAMGAGAAADAAFLLANRLFGVAMPAGLDSAIATPRARWLARRAVRLMTAGEPTERRLGTLGIHAWQVVSAEHPARELARQARAAIAP